MIPTEGVRVWLATGHTDMRCGFTCATGAGGPQTQSPWGQPVLLQGETRKFFESHLA